MIKVAIMGYGTVGSGVYEVFRTNKTSIDKKVGQELRVQYVLDLREFPGDPVMDVLTHDFEDILNDDEVKIVAEVMGGLHPAYEFTRRCLEAGKSVCTSNKELVAEHGAELIQIAKDHQVNYLFEASVGGGIPITTKQYRILAKKLAHLCADFLRIICFYAINFLFNKIKCNM